MVDPETGKLVGVVSDYDLISLEAVIPQKKEAKGGDMFPVAGESWMVRSPMCKRGLHLPLHLLFLMMIARTSTVLLHQTNRSNPLSAMTDPAMRNSDSDRLSRPSRQCWIPSAPRCEYEHGINHRLLHSTIIEQICLDVLLYPAALHP